MPAAGHGYDPVPVCCAQQAPDANPAPADKPAQDVPAEAPASAYPDREPLYFWFWGTATNQQEHFKSVLCKWYNESQDKYELILEFRGSVDADIPVALAAGQGPDIVYASGPSYTATYAQSDLVLD